MAPQVEKTDGDKLQFKILLGPRGTVPTIGKETGPGVKADGVSRYVSEEGSYRYVEYEHRQPVAVLQVVSLDGRHAWIANVYVVPEFRRQGRAARLLARARKDFKQVSHAPEEDRTQQGSAWAGKVMEMIEDAEETSSFTDRPTTIPDESGPRRVAGDTYEGQLRKTLSDLGASDPDILIRMSGDFWKRCRDAGIDAKVAAATIYTGERHHHEVARTVIKEGAAETTSISDAYSDAVALLDRARDLRAEGIANGDDEKVNEAKKLTRKANRILTNLDHGQDTDAMKRAREAEEEGVQSQIAARRGLPLITIGQDEVRAEWASADGQIVVVKRQRVYEVFEKTKGHWFKSDDDEPAGYATLNEAIAYAEGLGGKASHAAELAPVVSEGATRRDRWGSTHHYPQHDPDHDASIFQAVTFRSPEMARRVSLEWSGAWQTEQSGPIVRTNAPTSTIEAAAKKHRARFSIANVAAEVAPVVAEAIPWRKVARDPTQHEADMKLAEKHGAIGTPQKVYELVGPDLAKEDQEVFLVIPLNLRGELKSAPYEVARGQRSRVTVGPADVMAAVHDSRCEGFIVVHNHPSGKCSPSNADLDLTKQIKKATAPYGAGVKFIDHVVIGTKQCFSIVEDKLYKFKA